MQENELSGDTLSTSQTSWTNVNVTYYTVDLLHIRSAFRKVFFYPSVSLAYANQLPLIVKRF